MPRGRPSEKSLANLKPAKPGEVRNPSGGLKLPPEVKAARKHNQITVANLLNKFMSMSNSELKDLIKEDSSPVLDMMIAKVVAGAIDHGDHSRLNFILDRLVGKVTDKVEHRLPRPTVIKLIGEDAALVLGSSKEGDDND